MGLFNLIFGSGGGSTVEVLNDHIWMSPKAKFAGVTKELNERANSDSVAILLVAHFSDTLKQLNHIAAADNGQIPVRATLASNLSTDIASSLNLDESATIDLIVAERHPMLSVDEKLMQFAEELPCRCRIVHHLSLHDPLLKVFVGEWVESILEKVGMTEDEAIESRVVSRRIKSAQQKIERTAFGNSDANSAALWLEKNCPKIAGV